MTRKDYVDLAAALKSAKPIATPIGVDNPKQGQWIKDVCAIANVLANDNPRFDRDRFEVACGFEH